MDNKNLFDMDAIVLIEICMSDCLLKDAVKQKTQMCDLALVFISGGRIQTDLT